MSAMAVKFPWDKLKPGQGFFIPCLDTEAIKEEGLRSAVPLRLRVTASVGVYRGKYGVLFILKRRS